MRLQEPAALKLCRIEVTCIGTSLHSHLPRMALDKAPSLLMTRTNWAPLANFMLPPSGPESG